MLFQLKKNIWFQKDTWLLYWHGPPQFPLFKTFSLTLRQKYKWKIPDVCEPLARLPCLSQPSREWQQRWEQSAWLAAVNWEENCCITFLIDSIKRIYLYGKGIILKNLEIDEIGCFVMFNFLAWKIVHERMEGGRSFLVAGLPWLSLPFVSSV